MYPRIARLNVDSTNNSSSEQPCNKECNLAEPIVSLPEDYDLVIEKVEIPISLMPINVLDKHHYIFIDYPPSAPAHPVLQPKLNIFSIFGAIQSVDELLEKVNKIITWDLLPSVSLGTFRYDRETERIEFKFGTPVDRNTLAMGVGLWFDERLVRMLDKIPGLYPPSPDPGYKTQEAEMYKLDLAGYLATAPDVVFKQQTTYLIPRTYGFKSVRIFSTLPTYSYFVHIPEIGGVVRSKMLTEFTLNSASYTEAQVNQIYIPSTVKTVQLTGVTPIDNFSLEVKIHYKNGKDIVLQYDPGEYLSLTLCFQKFSR